MTDGRMGAHGHAHERLLERSISNDGGNTENLDLIGRDESALLIL